MLGKITIHDVKLSYKIIKNLRRVNIFSLAIIFYDKDITKCHLDFLGEYNSHGKKER